MAPGNSSNASNFNDPLGRGQVQVGFEVTFAVLMCALSIVGNILVFWIIYTSRHLQNVTNLFIQNLTCIDLFVAAVVMPLWTVALYNGEWVLGQAACYWSAYIFYVSSNAALYTLLMIALNRYIRVVKYEHYSKIFGDKRVSYGLIALTWVVPIITCSCPFYGWGAFRFYPSGSLCTFECHMNNIPFFVFMALLQPSPYVIVFCYFKIYARVRNNRIQVCTRRNRAACQSAQDAENKTMFVAFAIICVFIISWIPGGTLAVLKITGIRTERWASAMSSYMVFISTCLHPAIYGLLNPPFKEAFKDRFKRLSQDASDAVEAIEPTRTGCTR